MAVDTMTREEDAADRCVKGGNGVEIIDDPACGGDGDCADPQNTVGR